MLPAPVILSWGSLSWFLEKPYTVMPSSRFCIVFWGPNFALKFDGIFLLKYFPTGAFCPLPMDRRLHKFFASSCLYNALYTFWNLNKPFACSFLATLSQVQIFHPLFFSSLGIVFSLRPHNNRSFSSVLETQIPEPPNPIDLLRIFSLPTFLEGRILSHSFYAYPSIVVNVQRFHSEFLLIDHKISMLLIARRSFRPTPIPLIADQNSIITKHDTWLMLPSDTWIGR